MPKYKIINPCFLYGEIHKTGSIDAQAEDAQPLVDSGSLVLADDDQINFSNGGNGDDENNNDQNVSGTDSDTSANSNLPADASSSIVENATATNETNVGTASENVIEGHQTEGGTATLVGGITKDGRIVELKDWKVPDLKKLAIDLEVKNANQLNKGALIEAITAIEFAAEQLEP